MGQGRARHLPPGLTSEARTGKATGIGPGTVRPFWYQLRVARAPVAGTAPTLPERGPSRTRPVSQAEAILLSPPEGLVSQ